MRRYADAVFNQFGTPLANISVTVRAAATPAGTGALSTIYSDNGITPKSNPVVTDANGRFDFFAADGRFDFVVTGADITSYTLAEIEISDATSQTSADTTWQSNTLTVTSAFKVPVSGGAAPTTSGLIAYDSTAHLFKLGVNGVTKTIPFKELAVDSVAIDTAVTAAHDTLLVTAAANRTITLPTAVGITGRRYCIKKVDAGAGAALVRTTGGQTIDGNAVGYNLVNQWQYCWVGSDGANWQIDGAN
jgi:hypothetical protein